MALVFQPHEVRVFEEARELLEKIEELNTFLLNNHRNLDVWECHLIDRQLEYMMEYHQTLTERIGCWVEKQLMDLY